jgi:hypothetical protein
MCANLAQASILIGIYFDAGPSTQDAGSITAYDAARSFWLSSLRLASLVEEDVVATMDAQGWQLPRLSSNTSDERATSRKRGACIGLGTHMPRHGVPS